MSGLTKQAMKWSAFAADRLRPPPAGVVVLIYHRIGTDSGLDVDLPVADFEDQAARLAASGRVQTLDAALDRLDADTRTSLDPVVITFDDGTADFADRAVPVLAKYGLPATLYVATDFVDRQVEFPNNGRPLSWAALRDVASTGLVTIGSHTHTHALLDRLAPDAIAEELDRADDLIADHVGARPEHFAYPKAVAGSSPADRAVRARYRSAALAGTRPNEYQRTDPYRLARTPIQRSDGARFFAAKLNGGMRLEDSVRVTLNRWRYRDATA